MKQDPRACSSAMLQGFPRSYTKQASEVVYRKFGTGGQRSCATILCILCWQGDGEVEFARGCRRGSISRVGVLIKCPASPIDRQYMSVNEGKLAHSVSCFSWLFELGIASLNRRESPSKPIAPSTLASIALGVRVSLIFPVTWLKVRGRKAITAISPSEKR